MVKNIGARLQLVGPYLVTAVAFGLVAAVLVSRGMCNADEGFYAFACKLVYEGQMPYRDFGYTQTPLFPYLQGGVMAVVGFGVREQRWLNVLWDALALGLVAWRFRRAALPAAASSVLLGLWVCSLPLFYYCVIGKTYALTQLLLVLAALGLWMKPGLRALAWVALGGVLAVGCRLTVGPAVALLYLGTAVRAARSGVGLVPIVLIPIALAGALFLPFLGAAPQNAYFWMWGYHTQSALPRWPWGMLLGDAVGMAPGLLGVAVYSIVRARSFRGLSSPSGWCVAAGGLGVVSNVFASGLYAEYAAPFWALLLLGAGGLVAENGGFGAGRRWIWSAALGLFALSAVGSASFVRRTYWPHYLDAVDDAAAFLRARTSSEALVVTPVPEVAMESGRRPHPRLVLGSFAVTVEMSPDAAEQLRIMHFAELVALIDSGRAEALVFLDRDNSNFERSVPSLRGLGAGALERLAAAINRRYRLAHSNTEYQVFLRVEGGLP